MRAPVEWIREYVGVPPTLTVADIVDAYIRIGLEVENVHQVPRTQGPLVVGRVVEIEELTEFKKPIRFTRVDVGPGHGPDGGDGPRGIVCGAQNFAVGDAVIVALPGTVLPGDFQIAARTTYGRLSDGMICSALELGIGDDHAGIVVLDPDAVPGTDAQEVLGSHDSVIEFSITPDRGYTLSIRGLARELAAALDVPFTDPADIPLRQAAPGRAVTIADSQRCARFVAVDATGVDPAARSPWQLRRRLLACGIRAISLAVDVTNYVMLEYGHPLHAFDAQRLDGGIVVRRAHQGERLRTLDGQDRMLTADDVVVADQSTAVSLAGVMGGEETEISPSTTDVVIEAASWDPASISRTVRRHRLPSEAARRYERAVDPAISAQAAEAAAALLVRHGGGRLGGRTDAGAVPHRPAITLRGEDAERLAGRYYSRSEIIHRLEQVGCQVEQAGTSDDGTAPSASRSPELSPSLGPAFVVTPASWRPDLARPADLVEEIARLEGYDTIVPVLPVSPVGPGLTVVQRRRRRIADDLAAAGLTEVMSFPFVGVADLDTFGIDAGDPRRRATRIANPLVGDHPLMATTLLPGLAATALRNISRGSSDLALFEIGQVVHPAGEASPPALAADHRPSTDELTRLFAAVPAQPTHLAVILTGAWEHGGWWGPGRAADTTDIFAIARRIGAASGLDVSLLPVEYAPWHPGRCAAVRFGDVIVGHAGELHPAVVERLGLPPRALALEIDLAAVPVPAPPVPPAVSPFPPVNLDVALVVDAGIDAQRVIEALRTGGGELLESVRLFDIYTGDQIAATSVSLAFALVVRAPDRTLTAAEATAVRDAAVAAAAEQLGAELRT